MSQPDVTGAGGPAGSPSPPASDADGAPGRPPGGDAAEGTRRPGGAARIRPPADLPARLRRAAIVFPFLILFLVLSVASGPFFTKVNLLDILDQQASTLIIAAAGTLVLVAGGIDLRWARSMRSPASPPPISRCRPRRRWRSWPGWPSGSSWGS